VISHVNRLQRHKQSLLVSLDEAYSLFKQWYLYAKVGFSSLFEVRPRNIVQLVHVILISMAHTSKCKINVNRK
jgi:hypothetical protein